MGYVCIVCSQCALSLFSQVDWSEPWLLCLLGFHIGTFVGILLVRKYMYVQAAILGVLGKLCVLTEYFCQLGGIYLLCHPFRSSCCEFITHAV